MDGVKNKTICSPSSAIYFLGTCMYVLLQIHFHCVHYSVHHVTCMEEPEAAAKDLKSL